MTSSGRLASSIVAATVPALESERPLSQADLLSEQSSCDALSNAETMTIGQHLHHPLLCDWEPLLVRAIPARSCCASGPPAFK